MYDGAIDVYKARIIADATRVLDAAGAAEAEALVLPGIAGKTPGQIRAAIAQAVITIDPDAARARRERAQKDARVELWREDAGTAAVCGRDLPPADALAADQRITAYARDLRAAGVEGTMDQLRARAFLDFTLGVSSFPPPDGPSPVSEDGQASPDGARAASGLSKDGPRPGSPGTDGSSPENPRSGPAASATGNPGPGNPGSADPQPGRGPGPTAPATGNAARQRRPGGPGNAGQAAQATPAQAAQATPARRPRQRRPRRPRQR